MTTGSSWHAQSVEISLAALGSSLEGMTPEGVISSQLRWGRNVLLPPKERTRIEVFISQFQSALIYILLIAAVISFLLREWQDAAIIAAVVVINAVIGFRQEIQAHAAMKQLMNMTPSVVHVIRRGQEQELETEDVVVGDIIILETGDGVPADGRWVENINLRVNESTLTGESVPAEKTTAPLAATTILQDRRNMSWRGTLIVGGRGKLLVTDVGSATRFGALVADLQTIDHHQTPFQRKISKFTSRLALITVVFGLMIFLIGISRQMPFEQVFLLAVSMIVSIVPEGLPVVITMAMAYGMWAMAKRQAIMRKLAAIETLGTVTVVATDKTGTLTYGEMMMARAWVDNREYHIAGGGYKPEGDIFFQDQKIIGREDPGLNFAFRLGALNNDSRFSIDQQHQRVSIGDPTELALIVAAEKIGWSKNDLDSAHPRIGEFPFDYVKKYMITWHQDGDQELVILKGAPQEVFALCINQWTRTSETVFTSQAKNKILTVFETWAAQALRGLAVAYIHRPLNNIPTNSTLIEPKFTFLGMFGLEDAIRPEATQSILEMHNAGIRTIMLTGDYRNTGRAVASRLGLLRGNDEHQLLDGSEVDRLADPELRQRLAGTTVATRLTPEHKLRIARLMKQEGDIVAMTGDGINDVPALLEANVGIAVGRTASAAAKEAADMILIDGNFMSIVVAISEGRRIFRNIRRVMYYLLATSFGELVLVMTTLAVGLPLPLLPTQIIWLNAITGPFLGLALAREPMAPSVMQERPHDPKLPIITPDIWRRILVTALAIGLSGLVVFILGLQAGLPERRLYALILTTIVMAELVNAITARSSRRSFLKHLSITKSMWLALVSVFILQTAILYIPVLSNVFQVAPLSLVEWGIAITATTPVIIVEEVSKWFNRRRVIVHIRALQPL